ncbi:toxin-antitoxin system HicB family antitoxin [Buttiauxella selenatireducens]|uniref:Toxin-antitoxin system HicB family antitoxin n=1 Tax=Buttiauxella selenatireducens TaxID=3073902 RepID=A0ABY9S8T2_9ENTR|nr:toxin-antitoxin system HicB family antitoxin [Buttiauxella sp. R73]WMY72457.1 toxin-antitoxin system HicB family antitoxin [Buttiauxella sp. R73]
MARKPQLKLSPIVPRPLAATLVDHRVGDTRPLQIRIDPQLHREIKLVATEQGKSMTAFLLECYHFWRSMNK